MTSAARAQRHLLARTAALGRSSPISVHSSPPRTRFAPEDSPRRGELSSENTHLGKATTARRELTGVAPRGGARCQLSTAQPFLKRSTPVPCTSPPLAAITPHGRRQRLEEHRRRRQRLWETKNFGNSTELAIFTKSAHAQVPTHHREP